MNPRLLSLAAALLLLPAIASAQSPTPQPKLVSRKKAVPKAVAPAPKPEEAAPKNPYADLSIGELVSEDPNRWSDKMSNRAAISGFVTLVAKGDDGDTTLHICENPRVQSTDRAHCVVAKCIAKIPCDVPQVGRPITVRGITRYDAKVGNHWWEINPIEAIEK